MSAAPASDPIAELRAAVRGATAALDADPGDKLSLERPPKPELGDYSTNAAMLVAPAAGAPPREVAERLRAELDRILGTSAERIEVAGPGFLNVFLSDRWHREAVGELLAVGERLGASASDSPERVLVEFVSANPTGPVTAASGRGAAFGDAVARLLEHSGHRVEREYYLNDAGTQVRKFAESIAARMRGAEPPEPTATRASTSPSSPPTLAAAGAGPDDLDRLERLGTEAMQDPDRGDAGALRRRASTPGRRSGRCATPAGSSTRSSELRGHGHVYESEGAVWLRTTEFGDDKDRVLIRADGEPTYFAPDIAYHLDKVERGHDRLINVLGADHHGYVGRMRAALAALDIDPDRFEALIMQMVSIVEGGERARMSKRRGDFVTLDELIDDIGVDATRFFILQRSHDTTLDLDLDLARSASQENPVYYVQYAHARIASILRKAAAEGVGRRGGRDRRRRRRRAGARRRRRAGRAGAGQAAARAAGRGARRRRRAALRTASAPTRWRPPPTSTPSTATAAWSAPPSRGPRRRGSASAWRRCGRSRPRSGCSG